MKRTRKQGLDSTRHHRGGYLPLLHALDLACLIERRLVFDANSVVPVNVFLLDKLDEQTLLKAWQEDAALMKQQPGCISLQLHRNIGETPTVFTTGRRPSAFRVALTRPGFRGETLSLSVFGCGVPRPAQKIAMHSVCAARSSLRELGQKRSSMALKRTRDHYRLWPCQSIAQTRADPHAHWLGVPCRQHWSKGGNTAGARAVCGFGLDYPSDRLVARFRPKTQPDRADRHTGGSLPCRQCMSCCYLENGCKRDWDVGAERHRPIMLGGDGLLLRDFLKDLPRLAHRASGRDFCLPCS
jgi:hypothetical protein